MVKSGRFLWNAGIFVMRLATLARELHELTGPGDRDEALHSARRGRLVTRLP